MNLLELFIGQVPEAIYFALFLILGKNIKNKRILFILLMVLEYFLLTRIFVYNIYFQIIYCFLTYVILKILYKNKTQITDIFLFMFSSLLLIIFSLIGYGISYFTIKNLVFASIIKDILMFLYLFLRRNKINEKYKKYYNTWNRKVNQKVRSLTVRNISIILFNIIFYIINLWLVIRIR